MYLYQVVLKECNILSYVSELCSIIVSFFASPSTSLNGLLYTCDVLSCVGQRNLFLKTIIWK